MYLLITQDGKILYLESDAMEPGDACFSRDLKWIKGAIEKAYKIGTEDAHIDQ